MTLVSYRTVKFNESCCDWVCCVGTAGQRSYAAFRPTEGLLTRLWHTTLLQALCVCAWINLYLCVSLNVHVSASASQTLWGKHVVQHRHSEIMMMRPHFLALCHFFPSVLCLQQAFWVCLCYKGCFKRKYKRKHNVVCSKKTFPFLSKHISKIWNDLRMSKYFFLFLGNELDTLKNKEICIIQHCHLTYVLLYKCCAQHPCSCFCLPILFYKWWLPVLTAMEDSQGSTL